MSTLQQEGSYLLTETSDLKMGFSDRAKNCYIDEFETGVYRSGILTITKLDKANGIFSGTFSATLYKEGCGDTIRITKGRFDLK
jgi:hypothetical protein